MFKMPNRIDYFSHSLKIDKIIGLFVLLVALIFLSPKRLSNRVFQSFIGRILVVGVVVFFSSHNIILGIFSVLIIAFFIQNNMKSFLEGMEDGAESDKNATLKLLKKKDTIQTLIDSSERASANASSENSGVDKQMIHNTIQAKSSNELPIPSMVSSDDVIPATTTEPFTSSFETI